MILRRKVIACTVLTVGLYGCSDTSNYDFENSLAMAQQEAQAAAEAQAANPAPVAIFDPASGEIPFPNSLLFGPDGTLNVPLGDADPTDLTVPQVSLNAMDGFSTTSPIVVELSGPVNPDTVILGQSIRVFEVETTVQGVVTGVVGELDTTQLIVSVVDNGVAIVPVQPLKESADYAVVVTNGIVGINDLALKPSTSFLFTSEDVELTAELIAPLEPIRIITSSILRALVPEGVDRRSVVQAWTFKTQSITPVLQAVKDNTVPANIVIAPTGLNTNNISESLPGFADIYIGTIELPYYLTAPENANDLAGVTSFWQTADGGNLTRFNPTPVATSTQTAPVLMTVPNASSGNAVPADGWPVTIFVHGVTSDRSTMIAIADAMAQAGFAMIAIDQPMHGVTDTDSPLYAGNTPFNETERTFDIDLVNNETGAPGPDGVADSSGRHFFVPPYMLATRDNLRQSVADLFVLSESLTNITSVPVDSTRKTVLGVSLGSSVVTPFLAFDTTVSAATLAVPAASLVQTILTSDAFGPPIIAGLAAVGLEAGTEDFQSFTVAYQTVIDSGDAINFGQAAVQSVPVHMIEVIGDTTVKNSVPGLPLVGTDALARIMGLPQASQDTTESAIVRFTAGDHSSLLNPTASLDATLEMQAQTAAFAASNGGLIRITNGDVVE